MREECYWQSRTAGLHYAVIPKCACTGNQIAMVRAEWEGSHPDVVRALASDPEIIHTSFDHAAFMQSQKDKPLQNLFRYTFVRDPRARFQSFFNDKVLGVKAQKNEFGPMGFSENMTPIEAVKFIESIPHPERNNHFASQVDLIVVDGELTVDFIGRMERFSSDLHTVLAASKTRIREEWFGYFNRASELKGVDTIELDKASTAKVEELYADDMAFFGYETQG